MTVTRTLPGRTIQKEVFIAAAPERIYRAFIEPEQLERWFSASVTLDPHVGGRWSYRWSSGNSVDGVIVELDPPRLLVMDWDEGAGKGDTRLTVELVPHGDGTRVRLTSSGYGTGEDWDALYDGVDRGWGEFLTALNAWIIDGIANPNI